MLADSQVRTGFDADRLHSSGLFSTQRANEEISKNVFIPIKLILDIVRQNRRSGRARDIIWIQPRNAIEIDIREPFRGQLL